MRVGLDDNERLPKVPCACQPPHFRYFDRRTQYLEGFLEHPHQTGHRPGHNCTGGTPGIVWVYPTYCWSPLARVHAPLRGRPPPSITPLPDSISLVRCLARIPIPCPMCCPIPYPIPFGSPPGNILKSLVN